MSSADSWCTDDAEDSVYRGCIGNRIRHRNGFPSPMGGMNHTSVSAPPRRTRRIVLLSLAILGLAAVAFVVRRPLMMSAPRCMAGRWHGCYDTENGVLLM